MENVIQYSLLGAGVAVALYAVYTIFIMKDANIYTDPETGAKYSRKD